MPRRKMPKNDTRDRHPPSGATSTGTRRGQRVDFAARLQTGQSVFSQMPPDFSSRAGLGLGTLNGDGPVL